MIHPVDHEPNQDYGDNPTRDLPADNWIIKMFGNYQPDGHTGIDYPCPAGTPIRAVTSGRVLHVGWFSGSYSDNPYWIAPGFAGWCYVIDHGDFVGIYAHGQEGGSRVTVGQTVTEGQVIGLSGNTGGSTGPHLHFEVLPNGWIVNSYMYGRINPATLFSGITVQSSPVAPPKPPVEESEMPQYTRISVPPKARRLAKNKSWPLIDAKEKSNLNFAAGTGGFGYYDVSLFLQGSALPAGETLTVQFQIIVDGKSSNYFAQEIPGTKSGNFRGLAQFKMPILKPSRIEATITSSVESAYVVAYGADVYNWKKV